MKIAHILFAMILCAWVGLSAQPGRVLIIGIDGCRPDALQAAATPNIDGLISNATYSWDAMTEWPTVSGPGWSSMLTAVWSDKHGVTDNSFAGSNYEIYPHFFNRVEETDPALETYSVVHWDPINDYIVDLVDQKWNECCDANVASRAVQVLQNNDPDVLFLHFDDVDITGHSYRFNTAIPEYMSVIETTDGHIGTVLSALQARPNYNIENWIIILSTDHGGLQYSHGGGSPEERIIFFIASGDAVANQEITKSTIATASVSPALDFDGSNDYVSIAKTPLLNFGVTGDFTIECRVKTAGWSGDPSIIGDKDWDSGSNPGFILAAYWDDEPIKRWKVNIGDGSDRIDLFGGQINDDVWHHLAVSCDRDGQVSVFQDGIFVTSTDMSFIGNINTPFDLAFGQDGTLTYGDHFDGIISEVRIWNTVLSEAVLRDWSAVDVDGSHPAFANLVGHWRMNEGTGAVVNDASGNGHHGTVSGAAQWSSPATSYTAYDYSQTPRITDVAATALEHLCIPADAGWELDGGAVGVTCDSAKTVDLSISIDPQFDPVPAAGDTFPMAMTVSNNGTTALTITLWIDLVLPGGARVPALTPRTIPALPAGGVLSRSPLLRVAGAGPAGSYTVEAYWTWAGSIDTCLAVSGFEKAAALPTAHLTADVTGDIMLEENFPNPFNSQTMIQYAINRGDRVNISVFDAAGRMVATLVEAYQDAGTYRVSWNGTDQDGRALASGIYLLRLKSGSFSKTHKMLLAR